MARSIGPLFSTAAAGALAGSVYALKTRRGHALRKLTAPTVRWTSKQRSARAFTGFLTKAWRDDIVAGGIAYAWEPLAREQHQSPYHTYLQINQQRWAKNLPPIFDPLETPGVSMPAFGVRTFTVGRGSVVATIEVLDWQDAWSFFWCIDTQPFVDPGQPTTAGAVDGFALSFAQANTTLIKNLQRQTKYWVRLAVCDFAGTWLGFLPAFATFTTL